MTHYKLTKELNILSAGGTIRFTEGAADYIISKSEYAENKGFYIDILPDFKPSKIESLWLETAQAVRAHIYGLTLAERKNQKDMMVGR